MKKLFIFILICSIFHESHAQGIIRPVQLGWDVFKKDKPIGAEFDAMVFSFLKFSYRIIGYSGNQVKLGFDIKVAIDTSASYFDYSKKYKDYRLLKHEQGHLDISFIYANKLLDSLNRFYFHRQDYVSNLKNIFDDICKQMQLENEIYDRESDHNHNHVGQQKWDCYFERFKQLILVNKFKD